MPAAVRIGVIGAGIMGADHVATLHRLRQPGAAVAAIADVDPARARRSQPWPGDARSSPTPSR